MRVFVKRRDFKTSFPVQITSKSFSIFCAAVAFGFRLLCDGRLPQIFFASSGRIIEVVRPRWPRMNDAGDYLLAGRYRVRTMGHSYLNFF